MIMITNDFVQYLAMVRQDYTGVDGVIDSVDDLMDSVHHLQHDLLDKVKSQLTMKNVNVSIKRLESIRTMNHYSTDSLSDRLRDMDTLYQDEFFLDGGLSDALLKPSFIEDLLNFSPLLEDEFNLMLLDVSESIGRLYKEIADDVYSDIRSLSVKKESKPLNYLTYLSSRLKDMDDMLHDIVEGQEVDYRIDEIDKEAVIRMRELIHYNVLEPNESLYLYVGDLTNEGVETDDLLRGDWVLKGIKWVSK